MKSDRWQKLDELFHAALEREPQGRAAFVVAVCGSDDELLRELQSMLAHHDQANSFIESPAYALSAKTIVDDDSGERLIGRAVGPYQILNELGAGGMGTVYLAFDNELRRKVALKFLHSHLTDDPRRAQRFKQEARAASALNHPNILTIHEIGEIDRQHFIATEFVQGETLRAVINRGPMNSGEALEVAMQIASALSAAHSAGIVHRDIKPENIMLRPDGYIKIVDFGVAKLVEQTKSDSNPSTLINTEEGTALGTVRYMSPEQVRALDVDARTDLWSLGVVVYEMIAGSFPFEGATAGDLIVSILKSEPPSLSRDAKDGLPGFERIVHKALQKELSERYQTAGEMLTDLKVLQQGAVAAGQPGAILRNEKTKVSRESSLTRALATHWRLLLMAFLLVVASAVVITYSTRPSSAIDSLAVMPLVNASGDPTIDYLGEGIAEMLINDLSRLPKFKVIARSSTFSYKGKNVDPKTIGHDLDVRAVLTGSVMKKGAELVISVELANANDNSHIWGARYTRGLSDLFALQEEIANNVSEKLRLSLAGPEAKLLQRRHTPNPEAHQLLLEGYYYYNRGSEETLKKSVESFNRAIAKDPNYALPYAGLADAYFALSGDYMSSAEAIPKARIAALRALELDSELAEAHAVMATIMATTDWDWPGSEKEFRRAIELNPGSARAHLYYGYILSAQGRWEDSLKELRRARELDPVASVVNLHLGWTLYLSGQADQAIEQIQRTIRLDPNFAWGHSHLGWVYSQQGRYADALAELERASSLDATSMVRSRIGCVYAISGNRVEAERVLNELLKESQRSYANPYEIAALHASLGNKDRAFEWLDRAYKERVDTVVWLKVDARFTNLYSDPRYADLLRRIGLN